MIYIVFFGGFISAMVLCGIISCIYKSRTNRQEACSSIPVMPNLSQDEMRLMAFHEAGHAIVASLLSETLAVTHVSLSPPQGEYGFGSVQFEADTRINQSQTSLLHEIAISLAGRLAEEICLGKITSSCIHDLQKANYIARLMVCTLGMGKRCHFFQCCYNNQEQICSQNLMEQVEQDVQEILQDAETIARDLISKNEIAIQMLATELFAEKTLSGSEIAQIVERGNVDDYQNS